MNYCTNYCDSKQLLQRHPLRNPALNNFRLFFLLPTFEALKAFFNDPLMKTWLATLDVNVHELEHLFRLLDTGTGPPSWLKSAECQKPQSPLLLKKVSKYTSNLHCNTPPICIAVPFGPYALRKGKYCQYSSHSYRPFVLQYASHLYRSTFGKILVVVVTGMLPI